MRRRMLQSIAPARFGRRQPLLTASRGGGFVARGGGSEGNSAYGPPPRSNTNTGGGEFGSNCAAETGEMLSGPQSDTGLGGSQRGSGGAGSGGAGTGTDRSVAGSFDTSRGTLNSDAATKGWESQATGLNGFDGIAGATEGGTKAGDATVAGQNHSSTEHAGGRDRAASAGASGDRALDRRSADGTVRSTSQDGLRGGAAASQNGSSNGNSANAARANSANASAATGGSSSIGAATTLGANTFSGGPDDANHGRGEDWGLPGRAEGATGITRPINVACYADRVVVFPEDTRVGRPKVLLIDGPLRNDIDALISTIWQRMESWGIAGSRMYWKPILQVQVQSGADARYAELVQLLEDSGIVVKRK